jgi:hypothetical protein
MNGQMRMARTKDKEIEQFWMVAKHEIIYKME